MNPIKAKWSGRKQAQPMSAADWSSLQSIIMLPAEARSELDRCFSSYRRFKQFKEEDLTNSDLKKSLTRISAIAQRYVNEIRELGPSEYFWLNYCRGHYVLAKTDEEFSDAIWDLSKDAQTSVEWLTYAASKVHERESIFRETNWVVGLIDAIGRVLEQHTGDRARRGSKAPAQFIRAACSIADPALGPGTIEEAFKLVAKRNRNLAKSSSKKT